MMLLKKGKKTFSHFKAKTVIDNVGGVTNIYSYEKKFEGKLQPLRVKNEFYIAGHTFIAHYRLFCPPDTMVALLDGIGSRGEFEPPEYIIIAVNEFNEHTELLLEDKNRKLDIDKELAE